MCVSALSMCSFKIILDFVLIFAESESEIVVESLLSSSNLRSSMPTQQLQSLRYVLMFYHISGNKSCSVFISKYFVII